MAYSSAGASGAARGNLPLILGTLFLSLAFEFLPWPGWALGVKPVFPSLALVYWAVFHPQAVNYAAAVALGVMMDLAGQLPLGFTALAYTGMVLLVNGMRGRFSLLDPFGQAVHVLFVLCCGQAVLFVLIILESGDWAQFGVKFTWGSFAPSASASGLWLFLPLLMRRLGRLLRGGE
ncbi:MAG: rod shape-determining protein MreD [Gammaproteobacteria bacterium]